MRPTRSTDEVDEVDDLGRQILETRMTMLAKINKAKTVDEIGKFGVVDEINKVHDVNYVNKAEKVGEVNKITVVNKVYEGRPNIVDRLKDGEIAMVLNTTEGVQAIADSRDIRSVALYDKIPYFTTAAGSIAAVAAIRSREEGEVGVRSLQA